MKTNRTTNRNGVTLLFVISMIVLFLLMGTTFVVVSSDFMQSAQKRSLLSVDGVEDVFSGTGHQYIQDALFDLIRGPELENLNSPLRGHSLLGDMYGYGLETHIKSLDINIIETPSVGGSTSSQPQFIRMQTVGLGTNGLSRLAEANNFVIARRILRNELTDDGALLSDDVDVLNVTGDTPILGPAPGRFNGLLVTIVDGPATGLTARIVDHQVFTREDTKNAVSTSDVIHQHVFVMVLVNSVPEVRVDNLLNNVVVWDQDGDGDGDNENPTRVIINGRPFAGSGAGRFFPSAASDVPSCQNSDPTNSNSNNPTLLPNRRFQGFDDFAADYLGFSNGMNSNQIPGNASATNESYDATDFQNMFLSGLYYQLYLQALTDGRDQDQDGQIDEEDEAARFLIPSFHRRELQQLNNVNGAPTTTNQIARQYRYSFRPEYFILNGDLDARSTAGPRFPHVLDPAGVGSPPPPIAFEDRPLDVDNDRDGTPDSNWIDIGLPAISTGDGKIVRPLVSYLVRDLDSCANINVHSNLSHVASNDRYVDTNFNQNGVVNGLVPMLSNPPPVQAIQGMGFGPAEIDLREVFSDSEVERLLVGVRGPMGGNQIALPGRYGFDPENGRRRSAGGGPVAGIGDDNTGFGQQLYGQDPFSAYKFFGYPNVGPNVGGVIGGLFQSSPMDVYGRFRVDYASAGGITGMPVIDIGATSLTYSEIINNPYEATFGPPPQQSPNDTPFGLNELERILRQFDHDIAGAPSRLAELAPSLISSGFNRNAITTDSWEVPTQFATPVNGSLDTLVGKLYHILSRPNGQPAPNSQSIGVYAPMSDAQEIIQREQIILENIAGFKHELDMLTDMVPTGNFLPSPERKGMLSTEVRAGLPFDVNRPFGNGLDDDDGDRIVDEPTEYDVANGDTPEPLRHPGNSTHGIDYDNDGLITRGINEGIKARQKFARDLYMLVLLTTEVTDRDRDGRLVTENPPGSGQFQLDGGDFRFNGMNPSQGARLAFRSLVAQWAINVAEFRDPDSIMTPFEVDLNPFDGWDVDGDIDSAAQEDPSFRRVFWGTERPELLLTESLALHDRRTENLPDDNGQMSLHDSTGMEPNDDDDDFDSRLVPQASAFIELYSPWVAPGNQVLPAEFDPENQGGIDLTQMSPGDNGEPQAPVWRILAVNHARFATDLGLQTVAGFDPAMDPHDPNIQVLHDDAIRRIIYFNRPGLGHTDPQFSGSQVYHPDNPVLAKPVILEPGNYAIVGSAGQMQNGSYTTLLGRRSDHASGTGAMVMVSDTRRIEMELDANGQGNDEVRVYNTEDLNEPQVSADGTRILPIIAFDDPNRSLGFTDPEMGYGSISVANVIDDMEGEGQMFVDPGDDTIPVILDEPVDKMLQTDLYNLALGEDQLRGEAFVILLQRLADPTRDWDAESNPYRTVDSIGCDLFAFNGIDGTSEDDMMVMDPGAENPVYFGTYERRSDMQENTLGQNVANDRYRILWKTEHSGLNPDQDSVDVMVDADTPPHILTKDLDHSLGRLNQNYEQPEDQTPPSPFAWLVWNNRPFVSAHEIANVPYTSSYHLTNRFDISQKSFRSSWNHYRPQAIPEIRSTTISGEFPHLLNFHSDDDSANPILNRLFDYVEVPSRYVGTESYINPDEFAAADNASFDLDTELKFSITRSFAPPFDYLSNFRVPGKVNINTITDYRVWNAVMQSYARNRDDSNGNNMRDEHFIEWVPQARFNPYRASNAANAVPSQSLVVQPSDCGLYRRSLVNTNGWPTNQPTFSDKQSFFDHEADIDRLNDPLNNSERNAFHSNNKRNRLGNLVTGRSSMFAIWVTVGYFEIENLPAKNNLVNPVQDVVIEALGAEATDEFGQSTRNRGFFVFDRSIPVAFEPGKNHNVQRAIRVSSFIE